MGSFTVDGESFENVDIFSCAPFSFGSDPDPRDLSLLGFLGGMTGLEVELSHSQGVELLPDHHPDGMMVESGDSRALEAVVAAEGPVQHERLAKLVAAAFDLNRVRSDRITAILACLPSRTTSPQTATA